MVRGVRTLRGASRLGRIEAIFFDVGGTLVCTDLGHIDLLHEALRVIGYPVTRDEVLQANDLARRAVARSRRHHAKRMDTGQAGHMWLEHLATELRLDLRPAELEQELGRAIQRVRAAREETVDADAIPLLEQLQKRHFRLGVISNWSADLPEYLAARRLARFFKVIVASEAVGSPKPHREIFLRALTAVNCRPERAIHVGDDYWADVVGAREIGIQPVLLDRDREAIHYDCITITHLRELANLV